MNHYVQYTTWDNPKEMDRPLIVGYVSPDYFTHSVSYFIEAPLSHHDYANYKVVVYSAVVKVKILLFLLFLFFFLYLFSCIILLAPFPCVGVWPSLFVFCFFPLNILVFAF